MNSRSFVSDVYYSCTVDYSSVVFVFTDFNGYITCSVVTYDNNNCSVSLVNYYHIRFYFDLFDFKDCVIVAGFVFSVSIICYFYSVVSNFEVRNNCNCFTIYNTDCDYSFIYFNGYVTCCIIQYFNSDYCNTGADIFNSYVYA